LVNTPLEMKLCFRTYAMPVGVVNKRKYQCIYTHFGENDPIIPRLRLSYRLRH